MLDVNGILVRSTKCDNVNIRKTLESQYSPLITGELGPLFLSYSALIPRKGLGRFLRFVLSNFHVVIWSSKLVKNLQPIVRHFFKGCRHPEFVFGQEMCHILKDESGQNLPSPMNVDSSFFMKDLCTFFEWSRMHPVLHTKQPSPRTTLLVDDSPYKCIPNPFGSYVNPPPFLSNQSLDTLHKYLQRLLSSQQYVPNFVGSNPYPSGQGPFNLVLPSSHIYKHALARHKILNFARIVPEAQMSM